MRKLAICALAIVGVFVISMAVTTAIAPASSAAADEAVAPRGAAEYPVVIIPGWGGLGISVDVWWQKCYDAGFNVVNFNGVTVEGQTQTSRGVTYLHCWETHSYVGDFYESIPITDTNYFAPTSVECKYTVIAGPAIGQTCVKGAGIRHIATQVYNTITQRVLFEEGTPHLVGNVWHTPKIDVVTHSMGGLVLRAMVAMGYLSGKVDDAVTVAAPHWGVPVSDWGTSIPNIGLDILEEVITSKGASAWDMRTDSMFLDWLDLDSDNLMEVADLNGGIADVHCIAGNPWYCSWLPGNDMWADPYGLTGFDALVPQDGALLIGSDMYVVPDNHGSQLFGSSTVNDIISILGRSSSYSGSGAAIVGDVYVKVKGIRFTEDVEGILYDDAGEFYYKVWADTLDGSGYRYLGQIDLTGDDADRYSNHWYTGTTPSTSSVELPGNQPYLKLKVEIWDQDVWPDGDDLCKTLYFDSVVFSNDIDGVEAVKCTGSNGWELYLYVCGFTGNPVANCYKVNVYYERMHVDYDNDDWPNGDGEIYSKTWAGRSGYEKYWQSGIVTRGDNSDIYYNRYLVQNLFMLKGSTLRIRIDPKEDDGIWGEDDMNGVLDWSGNINNYVGGAWNGWWGTDFGDFDLWVRFQVNAM